MTKFILVPALIISIALSPFVGFPQTGNDSIEIALHKLNFTSEFERESFFDYFLHPADSNNLKVMLALDSRATYNDYVKIEKEIKKLALEIRSNSKFNKSDEKRIKYIFNLIHEDYLIKYQPLTRFYDIFNNGKYNCLTASLLYALVFDELEIPYGANFSNDHVFLIAYPLTSRIIVETTNPAKGAFVYSLKDKHQLLEDLIEMKIITREEYNSIPTDSLFRQYFLNQLEGGMAELIGAQYYNLGIECQLDSKVYKSYDALIKALHFNTSAQIKVNAIITGAQIVHSYNYDSEDDIPYQLAYIEMQKRYYKNDIMYDYFAMLTNNFLSDKNKPFTYDKVYSRFLEIVTDSAWREEIMFIYNYERGRHLFNAMNYETAQPYIIAAFRLRFDGLEIQNLIASNTYYYIKNQYPEESLKLLTALIDSVPAMTEIKKVRALLATYRLLSAEYSFYMMNEALAFRYLQDFENCSKDDFIGNLDLNEDIENVYSTAGMYHFKKSNYKKARNYFQKGLDICPGSVKLKIGLEQLKNY
ncbi:MAG: hypothetical protein K9H64_22190 [Bacteroidales bacterium]|nr:hypothetical protein [Bacteroidales bacterium]MCF8458760.1 hypothetical protein [Bacteroidales bacterium]